MTAYREGEPEPIVTMMATASYAAINNGRQLVADLHRVRESWNERITARRGATAWKVADLLLSQPVVDSTMLEAGLDVSDVTALDAIRRVRRSRRTTGGSLTSLLGASAGGCPRRESNSRRPP